MLLKRPILASLILGECSNDNTVTTPSSTDPARCSPFRSQLLNEQAGCLEDIVEFRCDRGGCDEAEYDAVDAEGNCHRMLGCPPPEWKNSVEDELPKQCERLSWSLPACSELTGLIGNDAASDAPTCVPFRARPLNDKAGCLEDIIEFGCDNVGCEGTPYDAVDAEGNCYRMLGCPPAEWKNSVTDELPEQCEPLSSSPLLCSALPDAALDGGEGDATSF